MLAESSGRRLPGIWWSPIRSPAVMVATWLEGHTRGMAPVRWLNLLQSGSATQLTSTLTYSNPSPSSHGSAMVRVNRRGLILTKLNKKREKVSIVEKEKYWPAHTCETQGSPRRKQLLDARNVMSTFLFLMFGKVS